MSPSSRQQQKPSHYLIEHRVFAAQVQRGVVSVLHSQTSVDVESGHKVWLTGLWVLQALGDEGWAAFGQQQELLYALEGAKQQHKFEF